MRDSHRLTRHKSCALGDFRRNQSQQAHKAITLDHRLIPKLTVALIAISVLIAFGSRQGEDRYLIEPLLFDTARIRDGQWWRLVTPIFVHFGIFHIAFNSAIGFCFGAIVEHLKGRRHMLLFTLSSAVVSNLSEALIPAVLSGPAATNTIFGGLSGVVYAFFGFSWMQSRYNPTVNIPLKPEVVIIMLGWFVACWIGVMPDIANWAHTGGLLTGIVWGRIICVLDVRRVQPR